MAVQKRYRAKALEAAKLVARGVPYKEIAERLGVTRISIHNWFDDEEFQAACRAEAARLHMRTYHKACSVLAEQLDHKNPWVRQNAARDLATRYEVDAMGRSSTDVHVIVEGLPAVGMPDAPADD